MRTRTYRAGIVGCGRKGATLDDEERCRVNYSIQPDAHAAACRQVPGVQAVAAADPNESKRRMMQERWGVGAVYADYREMLARERLDLLSVTTRTPQHAEVTLAAAAAGVRGILCEKAMACSLREADAMIDACRRTGTVLLINHTRRWHPTFERAKRLVAEGAIGDLRCLVGTCPGPLIHHGTHLFDIMRFFAGNVAWVSGQVRVVTGEDDPGRAMLAFENGAVGFVDLDGSLGFAIEIQGTIGRLVIDSAREGLTLWRYLSAPQTQAGQEWYRVGPCKERTSRHLVERAEKGTLVRAVEELITCMEEGQESRSGGGDGRAALELALAVYQSQAGGGRRVMCPLRDRDLVVRSR